MRCKGPNFVVILALILLSISATALAETRRAVIVGIDQYIIPDAPLIGRGDPPDTRFWTNLNGAVNDATRIRGLLIARFGFDRDNIVFLTNQDASRAAIVSAIEDHLVEKTTSGDVAFLYYAGHGSRVRNSLSAEIDKLDESLVPADAATGARDIRDKELRDLLNRIIDKGGKLTVALDSCHSGSATRGPAGESPGLTRVLPMDPRDVRDDSVAPSPWERGALVLSATQKGQEAHEDIDEFGEDGGVFSIALARALRTGAADEPVQNLFRRLQASMKASGRAQDPGLEGTDNRRAQSFFGSVGSGLTGRSVAAVESVNAEEVTLQEGIAAGLTVNSELTQVEDPTVRIRVDSVDGLVTSHASILTGDAGSISPGDLFVIDRWAPPDVPNLRVWIPKLSMSTNKLVSFAADLRLAVIAAGHEWISDPTLAVPSDIVRFEGEEWLYIGPDGAKQGIGEAPTAAGILELLPSADDRRATVFLNLPAPASLATAIKLGEGTTNNAIALEASGDQAEYHLVGRLEQNRLSFAWVRPWVSSASESAMPWITSWTTLSGPLENTTRKLESLALKLGYINAWLRLEGPSENAGFPYQLALRVDEEDRYVVEGQVHDGERYALALKADAKPAGDVDWRYVYIFALDRNGKSTLLYPRGGATENRYPPEEDAGSPDKAYVLPDSVFQVSPPYGIDTFIMIATTTQLPDKTVFESSGVRAARSANHRGSVTLSDLLRNIGAKTRGQQVPGVPTNWSIQRIFLESRSTD